MELKDKVVLITGASRGIGAATARMFAEEGAKVMINYISNHDTAVEVFRSLKGEGHSIRQSNIGNPESCVELINAVENQYGKLDVLVNNAGVFFEHPPDRVKFNEWVAAWEQTLAINLTGPAHLSYLAAKLMMRQHKGYIINVSSRGAFRGEPDCPAYGASKGGLNALTQSLARALGKYNISVTAVAPGFVNTDMAKSALDSERGDFIKGESPMGRVASPEEVAHIIVFLAKERSTFMTGGILDVNGASFLRM
ncbi:MAG TPA: SDR family oxidoreductase [Saprospiraceae bacterium]|nr:SDR family oxidoreductase [Saprospiraceae bacterium]